MGGRRDEKREVREVGGERGEYGDEERDFGEGS